MKPKVLFAALLRFFLTGFEPGFSKDVTESPPRVETPLGTIEGRFSVSSGGKSFEVYQGIPYAKSPTGELRFEAPERITPWTGILKAKRLGPQCIQYGHIVDDLENRVEGVEDCLYLNVYTPIRRKNENAKSTDSLFPVIFYIHGGAFQFGSGILYGPKYLLDREVTLVTINYRLGPLGFLSTEDEVVPGNMGLKDQAMALRWVSENIKFFGGDPSRVMIVGQSAGGASVHYHYLSKLSAGLFQRGISVSGCVLNSWPQTEASFEKAKKLATIVGCPSEESQAIVDCLKSRPAHQIVQAVEEFMPWLYNPYSPFGPVVEKKGGKSDPFIDRSPMEILSSGDVQDLPWITSVTSEEGLYPAADFVANEKLLKELNDNWETIAPHLLDFNYTIPQKDHAEVSKLIKQHYLGTKPIDKSTVNQIIQLIGDRLFVYHILEAAKLQAKVNKSPVRFYYFTYRGSHSLSEIMSGSTENFGVSHADDVPYALDTIFDSSTTPEDREMQKKYIDFWVSYATEGKPNVGVEWPAVSKSTDDFHYLHIAGPKNLEIRNTIEIGEKSFWQDISFRENIFDPTTGNGNRKTELTALDQLSERCQKPLSCIPRLTKSVFALNPIVSGSKDCLFLNVYTPATKKKSIVSTALLPVILFIPGGSFQFGSGAVYGPDYILNNDVVFVTFNYRVGPLGFLSTEDDTVPGNMSLKDQVIAMRWVKNNIKYFGGDPENVSLIGQSAGAVSVHYHYLTNVTEGLFQRGMSISGTALNSWAQTENSLEKAKKFATILGCPSDISSSMIECLKTRPADEITLTTIAFLIWLYSPVAPFGPVVEKGCSEFTFIDQSPIESITSGKVQDRPWIMTAVSEEGLYPAVEFISNETRIKELNDNWAEIAVHMLDFNYTIPESDKSNVAKLTREHYLGSSPIDSSTLDQEVNLLSDRLFLYNAEKAARLQAKATKSPVWFYYFSYRGAHSVTEILTGTSTNYGVCHLDDLAYVLYSYFDATSTDQDREMQKVLAGLWVSYATEGIPDVGVEWPALGQDEEFRYLHIAGPNDIYMDENSNFGNKNFWESIPFNENGIPLKN